MFRLMKLLTLLIFLFMTFSLIGCSSTSINSKNEASAASEEKKQTDERKVETVEEEVRDTVTDKEEVSAAQQTETKEMENKKDSSVTDTIKKNEPVTKVTEKKSVTSNTATTNSEKPKGETNTTKVKTETKKTTIPQNTVFITITGPKDFGVILPRTALHFKEGDTVFDILLNAGDKHDFQVDYTGKGAMAYIEGIDNVYEFDYGPTSGWHFKLNGKEVNKSSDSIKVQKDNQIEWIYSEDMTEDK